MFGVDDVALAIILAAGASAAGQVYTNSKNIDMQKGINDASINLANTAHQREVRDLLAAGLNPVLSTSGSGASVPSLGVANTDNPLSGLTDAMTSAAKFSSQEYKLGLEETRLTNSAQRLENKIAARENAARWQEADARKEQAIYDSHLARLKNDALTFLDDGFVISDDNRPLPEKKSPAYKMVKEALQAELKDAGNINWRNNLSSVMDALSKGRDFVPLKRGKGGRPITINNYPKR